MAAQKRQFNVRLSEESETRIERLVASMRAALGLDLSKADVIQAALVELEKRYPPPETKSKGKRS